MYGIPCNRVDCCEPRFKISSSLCLTSLLWIVWVEVWWHWCQETPQQCLCQEIQPKKAHWCEHTIAVWWRFSGFSIACHMRGKRQNLSSFTVTCCKTTYCLVFVAKQIYCFPLPLNLFLAGWNILPKWKVEPSQPRVVLQSNVTDARCCVAWLVLAQKWPANT